MPSTSSTKRPIRPAASTTGFSSGSPVKTSAVNVGITRAVRCLVRVIDTQALEQPACALCDLDQLLAPFRWGCARWLPFIQSKPKSRGFEFTFEVRNRLERSANCRRDKLKVRMRVGGHLAVGPLQ